MNIDITSLIENPVKTPIQKNVTNIKYPCVGFCYLALKNRYNILFLYLNNDKKEYFSFIEELIKKSAKRKELNKKIHNSGEYIDQETIKIDFPEIFSKVKFYELSNVDLLSYELMVNDIYMKLLDVNIDDCLIVNRSHEAFLLIKITQNYFFLVDSHRKVHGKISLHNVLQYISKSGRTKGLVKIGIYSDS